MDERTKTGWRHSLWILWTFTIVLNFVAFFWVGYMAKRRQWILSGCVYMAGVLIAYSVYALGDVEIYTEYFLSDVILTGFWVVSIIHAFSIRKAYLIRMGILEDTPGTMRRLRTKAVDRPAGPRRVDNVSIDVKYPIDLNKCTEREFTSLPGVSVVRAKRAVMIRSENDGFGSVDEFIDSLNIEPHFAVQIEKLATVSKFTPAPAPSSKGRKVDI